MNESEKKYVQSVVEVSGITMLVMCQVWQDEMIRAEMQEKMQEVRYDTQS